DLKMRGLPSCVSEGMLGCKILCLEIHSDAAAKRDLSSTTGCIRDLELLTGYDYVVPRHPGAGAIDSRQSFNEWVKAASGSKVNARACQHGVMLNLSGSAVADQLHGIGSGVATAEQAGCCQPPVEVRDPGSLPANAFDLRIAAGRARDFRSIERYTARHIEAPRDLRECARADKRDEKYYKPHWGFHVQSLLCSSAALLLL